MMKQKDTQVNYSIPGSLPALVRKRMRESTLLLTVCLFTGLLPHSEVLCEEMPMRDQKVREVAVEVFEEARFLGSTQVGHTNPNSVLDADPVLSAPICNSEYPQLVRANTRRRPQHLECRRIGNHQKPTGWVRSTWGELKEVVGVKL